METAGGDVLDILVIGAGPCGLAVGIAAREKGLSCAIFDRGAVTQSMTEHPTYTTYFSGPEKLEIGGLPFTTAGDKPTRREALRYYRKVTSFYELHVRQYEEVLAVERSDGLFGCARRRSRPPRTIPPDEQSATQHVSRVAQLCHCLSPLCFGCLRVAVRCVVVLGGEQWSAWARRETN